MDQIKSIADWIATIAEYTAQPIVSQVCYVVQCKSNIEGLQTEVDKLDSLKVRVQHSVEKAERNSEIAEDDVKRWLENVGKVIEKAKEFSEEANKFVEEEHQANKKSLHGFCANLKRRHQLGRKSTKLKTDVVELQTEGEKYTTQPVAYCPPLPVTFNTSEAFPSRTLFIKNIITLLAIPDINIIGVYGLGGVGKTTLVRQVCYLVQQDHLFDEVVMVAVSQKHPEKIQEEIADQLSLNFEQKSPTGKGMKLKGRTRNKKILIILDDIWEKLDLDEVGLDANGGCKILATARTLKPLRDTGTDKELQLEVLHKDESWTLFEQKAGDVVKDPAIKNIAVRVAKKCSDLPILIVSVASSLKNKHINTWKDALESLKRFDRNEMQEKTCSILEWTYNQLRDDEAKSFFLLCAMVALQNGVSLRDLLRYSFGLGILRNMDTLEQARNRLYSLVDYLKDFCLLLDGENDQYPKLHDVVRDAALWIAWKEHQVLSVTKGNELKEWPEKDFLERCTVISFDFQTTIHAGLPAKLQCPKLKLFILVNNNAKPLEVPENFFEEMKELKVLDLTNFGNLLLPPSFVSLANLQTLCLESCAFADDDDVLAKIGELRGLQILSLARSKVGKLCKEIGQLTCLRLLDLSKCEKLEVIPPNVLSNLSRLEELNMERSFKNWEAEGVTDERRINAGVSELKHLSQLTTLNVSVDNVDALPTNLFSDKLERFKISVGAVRVSWEFLDYETSKKLKLKLTRSDQLDQSIKMLIKKSEALHLDLAEGVSNCIPQLDSEGFPQLKFLNVEDTAGEMKHIVESINCTHSAFPNLESLVLYKICSVESVCYPQLETSSFGKLKTIYACRCSKLKNLFPFSMVNCFLHLQEMKLRNCDILEEVFVAEKGDKSFIHQDMDPTEFSQLTVLKLEDLPQFIGFSSIVGREDEILNNSAPLFNWKIKFPKSLEQLYMDGLNRLTSIWPDHDQAAPPEFTSKLTKLSAANKQLNSYQNLRMLKICGCQSLKYVFPASVARGLKQLARLTVESCKSIKEIIAKEEGDDEDEIINFVFPKVETLWLERLPKLGSFYPGMHTSKWPSLTRMAILECEKVETLAADISTFHHQHDQTTTNPNPPFFIEKIKFPKSLEQLEMEGLNRLTSIWFDHDQVAPPELSATDEKLNSYQNLRILSIGRCQSLKYVFPASVARGLDQLVRLTVKDCESIKEIIAKEEGDDEDEIIEFVFPKVERLWLENLPKLGSFYPGMHTSKWPSLTRMAIIECEKVETLAADISTFHHQHDQTTTNPNPLFFIEKRSFPKLECLEATAEEYLCGLLLTHAEWFPTLTKVNLICMHIKSTVSPFAYLLKIPALQDLTVQLAFFKEIFTVEQASGLVNGGSTNFKLWKLPKLIHLWDENSLALQHLHDAAPPIFPNTENVEVKECRSLKNLVPFAISFPNLKALKLYKCKGLNYLFTYSVATSLTKLESIKIEDCKRMTEIISVPSTGSGDDDDHDDTIILGGLKRLKLDKLPSLAGFCSGNSKNVKVPLLIQLKVTNCGLEMEISPDKMLVITDSKSAEHNAEDEKEEEEEEKKEEEEEDDDDCIDCRPIKLQWIDVFHFYDYYNDRRSIKLESTEDGSGPCSVM